jgi:lipopolysaccharide biosynthesis glycosyltransferase/tetratricopeptide (TPR) repeat protein
MNSPEVILAESLAAISEDGEDAELRYLAGRACIDLGQLDGARANLATCRCLEPGNHRALFELARVEFLAGDSADSLRYLNEFLRAHEERLSADELKICEAILDRHFPTAPRDLVQSLYLRVAQLGSNRHLTVLRAFIGAVDAKQWSAAEPLVEIMRPPQGAWEHLPRAAYHRARGEHDRAAQHALAAAADKPDDPRVARGVVNELLKLGRFETVMDFLVQARRHLAAKDAELLELITALDLPDRLPDLALACESAIASAHYFTLFLDRAGERLGDDQREQAYVALQRRFPGDSVLCMAMARLETRQRRYVRAREFAERALECSDDESFRFGIRFHLFRIACMANQMDRATELLAAFPARELNSTRLIMVSEYLAEMGNWHEAFGYLERGLMNCQELTPATLQHAVRTAERAQKQLHLLQALSRRDGELPPTVQQLAGALFEDWAAAEGRGHPQALTLAQELRIEITPLLDFKLSILAPQRLAELKLHLAGDRPPRRAVFYCADGAYVLPAAVSLASLLHANRPFHADTFYLVVEDELVASVQPVLERLSRHFGVRAITQRRSELAPDVSKLRPSWGFFTGGRGLSPAAYYRIYMARNLALSGEFDQLLYIDSDTVVAHGFHALQELPVPPDKLLMAAVDQDLPGIREATRRHGLVPGRYFNSGVLWFPRVNAALVERLRESERVAVERADQLMFLDQCALNIAFAGTFEPLPPRFNVFLGPKDADMLPSIPAEDACLLHMLSSPKPWDSSYKTASPVKSRWLDAAHELRHVVGDDLLRPLVEATFCS